jgi:hypothetical protein
MQSIDRLKPKTPGIFFAMKLILILAFALVCATHSVAAWNERVSRDHLTGAKIVRLENSALSPISHHGRMIVPKLVIQCIAPSEGAAYLGAFIDFGEQVAIEDTKIKYRFDDGAVQNETAGVSRRGDYFQMPGYGPDQTFIKQVRNSSRLRVELPLPAETMFLEFSTKDSAEAVQKARCF